MKPTPEQEAEYTRLWEATTNRQVRFDQFLAALFIQDVLEARGWSPEEISSEVCTLIHDSDKAGDVWSLVDRILEAERPEVPVPPAPSDLFNMWYATALACTGIHGSQPAILLTRGLDGKTAMVPIPGNSPKKILQDTLQALAELLPEEFVVGLDMQAPLLLRGGMRNFLLCLWCFEGQVWTQVVPYNPPQTEGAAPEFSLPNPNCLFWRKIVENNFTPVIERIYALGTSNFASA